MKDRNGKITFVTSIEMMAESEVVGVLGQSRIMEIKQEDPHPCFAGFVAGHEGVTRGGRSEKLGEIDQHWADDAVQSLADAFDQPRRGGEPIPCYWKHSDGSKHRKVIGQVEAARTIKRGGRWEAHTVCYIPEGETRNQLRDGKVDICSPECDVMAGANPAGGMEIVKVLRATGLALGATTLGHVPAFGGATFTTAIQMFADGDTQTNAEPKGRRPMEDLIIKTKEDLLMAVSQFRTAGILSENDLLNLPDVKKAFERESKRDEAKASADGGDGTKTVKAGTVLNSIKDEFQAKLDEANATITSMKVEQRLPEILVSALNKSAGAKEGETHNLTEKEVEGILGTIKGNKYSGTDEQIAEKVAEDIKPALNLVNLGRANASADTPQTKTPLAPQGKQGDSETKTGSDHEGVIPGMVDDALLNAEKAATGTQ